MLGLLILKWTCPWLYSPHTVTNQIFPCHSSVCTRQGLSTRYRGQEKKTERRILFHTERSLAKKWVNTSVLGENFNFDTKPSDKCFDLRYTIILHSISRNKPNIFSTIQSYSSVSNSVPYAE